MPVRWKVVTKDRESFLNVHLRKKAFKYVNLGWSLKYEKGEVVTPVEGSVGIFVFKTKREAENYRCKVNYFDSLITIKVNGIGRGIHREVSSSLHAIAITLDLLIEGKFQRYKEALRGDRFSPVVSVLTYKQVEVLT